MTEGTIQIHTENLLPIIKKWLYSDKEIFLRELVSNACDAIKKVEMLASQGEIDLKNPEWKISITADKKNKTLTIEDNGIGMSAEEVEKYIAQLAFSGAEEFLSKYKRSEEKEPIIGHFGLGFYSSYMVSKTVEIDTQSYLDAPAAHWTCDGGSTYNLDSSEKKERGTKITLHIDNDSEEFLAEERLQHILDQYCAFLPYPIYLNGKHLNAKEPLWLKNPKDCTDKEYLDFYKQLHPFEPDPIFWIHLNVDFPFHLKGILYFPKITPRFEWGKSAIKLFCNRVFVSDNCKDLVPDFLLALRGAIDSPDIPLNVSRSYLQMDSTVRKLATHISKKVADKLAQLHESEKEQFLSFWPDIETIVKLGALQDEKFYERCKPFLIWKNLADQWTTLDAYTEKHNQEYENKIFYTTEEKEPSSFLTLYKEQGIEVLRANSHIDTALMNFLETKISPAKFQRIDGGLDNTILNKEKEKTLLDSEGKTEAGKIADFFRKTLKIDNLEVEAKSLASDTLPAVLIIDEQMRRFRDQMALSGQNFPDMPDKRTFVLNTNSKLIDAIYHHKDRTLAANLARETYELALLSQKELKSEQVPELIARTHEILEKLL